MIISFFILSFYILFVISFILLFLSLYFLLMDYSLFIEWELININSSMILFTFLFDWMSLIFMSFVMMISSLVLFYSYDYMMGDLNKVRFIILVLLFILSMMFLILSPNLISILLGWDGLGLVSYCLVIYYQNVKSYNAGMLTLLSNRIGDIGILLSIAWMLNNGSWNYIYYYDFFNSFFDMNMMIFLLIISAMTKSAQIPFSSWLPAAMSAPTPVSALVHSSTLVTAGVYLMIRFNFLLMMSGFNKFLIMIGCLTMFISGLGANYETDLKKIIALSTLSQLGLMMSILSLGYWEMSFFHLLTHSLFKALLFLCAGSFIHNFFDIQDIRCMGSIIILMPFTSICFNVSSLSLCGLPFLAGFYSKDLILDLLSMDYLNIFIYLLFFLSVGLTVMYTFRLYYYSMIYPINNNPLYIFNNNDYYLNLGMFILLVIMVFIGSFLSWLIFPIPNFVGLPYYLKFMTLMLIILGFYMGWVIFSYKSFKLMKNIQIDHFFGCMLFMPYLSTMFIINIPLLMGFNSLRLIDYGWSELFGGQNLYKFFKFCLSYLQLFYDYNFKSYLMLFMFFMLILFILYIF
uniref:NADH-ubiquinone oxidoreductase chain 5 n=2 Tax=Paramastax nigra TaxID=1260743 RepID=M4JDJ8_9ORTH|nr:NADH dehydrogenase subunit 5 [Paramastax nigra]